MFVQKGYNKLYSFTSLFIVQLQNTEFVGEMEKTEEPNNEHNISHKPRYDTNLFHLYFPTKNLLIFLFFFWTNNVN